MSNNGSLTFTEHLLYATTVLNVFHELSSNGLRK